MSWLFKNPQSDDPGESTSSPANPTAIGDSIGRKLRGVAAFLAPPPSPAIAADSSPETESESEALVGIRNDLAEIGGSFKTGLTILSSNGNRAVGGISRLASSFWQFQNQLDEDDDEEEEEDDDEDSGNGGSDDYVPGITDEVLQFVTEISKRPECWTDFPSRLDHEFSMSDAQRDHASTIEHYIPDFASLRQTICNSMDDNVFWMIYFILLVPRLSGYDSEALSTPEITVARDVLLQKLHKKEPRSENSENSTPLNTSHDDPTLEQEFSKLEVSDKLDTGCASEKPNEDSGNSSATEVRFETEDDISFSDLEDEGSDVSQRLSDYKPEKPDVRTSSPSDSNDWVQLGKNPEAQSSKHKKDSEGEESSDWLNVDDEFD